jgi:hypothetical protein
VLGCSRQRRSLALGHILAHLEGDYVGHPHPYEPGIGKAEERVRRRIGEGDRTVAVGYHHRIAGGLYDASAAFAQTAAIAQQRAHRLDLVGRQPREERGRVGLAEVARFAPSGDLCHRC